MTGYISKSERHWRLFHKCFLSATHSWAWWGWRSCVNCSATGMEPASSARVRLDLNRKQRVKTCSLLSKLVCSSTYCFQIERFIRMGIPPSLRGRVWKCLLNVDGVRKCSDFNYQVNYRFSVFPWYLCLVCVFCPFFTVFLYNTSLTYWSQNIS